LDGREYRTQMVTRMKKKNKTDAVIHMTVKDDSDFLSVYSVTDTPVISSEVAQFLEHSIQDLIRPEHLTLIIKSNCIDDTEKELYRKGIAGYYRDCAAAAQQEFSRNRKIAWVLAFAGILTLIAIGVMDLSAVWSEVADIVAWVFLWESVDIHVFRNHSLRRDVRRYEALANMQVEYEEDIQEP